MKLNISYNVFDGEELLLGSIKQVREIADTISVVYQEVSNYGMPANKYLVDWLKFMESSGWVDKLIEFKVPSTLSRNSHSTRHFLEAEKRRLGLHFAKASGATHFMSMDVDEYYSTKNVRAAITEILNNGYDTTACYIYDFHSKPTYRHEKVRDFYVPFITEVRGDITIKEFSNYFCHVDPTRSFTGFSNPHLFDKDLIVMYHYTNIRLNLESKFLNHNAAVKLVDEYGVNYPSIMADNVRGYKLNQSKPYCVEVFDRFGVEDEISYYKEFLKSKGARI